MRPQEHSHTIQHECSTSWTMKAYLGRYILCCIYQLANRFPRKDVGKFRHSIWHHQSTTTSCFQPPSMTPPSTTPVTTPPASPPSPTACHSLLPSSTYNHGTQPTMEQPTAQDHKKQWIIDSPRLPAHQTENAKYFQNADT